MTKSNEHQSCPAWRLRDRIGARVFHPGSNMYLTVRQVEYTGQGTLKDPKRVVVNGWVGFGYNQLVSYHY